MLELVEELQRIPTLDELGQRLGGISRSAVHELLVGGGELFRRRPGTRVGCWSLTVDGERRARILLERRRQEPADDGERLSFG